MADLEAEFEFSPQEGTVVDADFSFPQKEEIDATFEINVPIKEHNDLSGRDKEDCHPMSSITGLSDALSSVEKDINNEKTERVEADNDLQEQINTISVVAKGYIHEQGIASAVWIIQHNLDKYPSVTAVDSAENEIVVDVEYLDKNSVKIKMNGASKGRAYLN